MRSLFKLPCRLPFLLFSCFLTCSTVHTLTFLILEKNIKAQTKHDQHYLNPSSKFVTISKKKQVLPWTNIYDTSDVRNFVLGDVGPFSQTAMCSYNCEFTRDRSTLAESDALMFHGNSFPWSSNERGVPEIFNLTDIPPVRFVNQHYIFFSWESPTYTNTALKPLGSFFNNTMSYRRDSDIYFPNGFMLPRISLSTNPTDLNLSNKTKLIAWIHSNGGDKSNRSGLAAELMAYVPVDIFGSAGKLKCAEDFKSADHPDWWYKSFKNPCYSQIGNTYKFYLAFENNLCLDYVTEKPFNALAAGMVPIVYGAGDYSQHLPQGSFIDVKDFPSVQHLAKYLLMLDGNDTEYLKYFEWRAFQKPDDIPFMARAWCSLCEMLTKDILPKREGIRDFYSWWYGQNDENCHNPIRL